MRTVIIACRSQITYRRLIMQNMALSLSSIIYLSLDRNHDQCSCKRFAVEPEQDILALIRLIPLIRIRVALWSTTVLFNKMKNAFLFLAVWELRQNSAVIPPALVALKVRQHCI